MQSSFSETSRAGTTLAWFLAVMTVSGSAVAICRNRGSDKSHDRGSALAERRAALLDVEAEAAARVCAEPATRIRELACAAVADRIEERRDLEAIGRIGHVRAALELADRESQRFSFERAHERFLELERGDGASIAERELRAEAVAALGGDDDLGLIAAP